MPVMKGFSTKDPKLNEKMMAALKENGWDFNKKEKKEKVKEEKPKKTRAKKETSVVKDIKKKIVSKLKGGKKRGSNFKR